MRYSLPQQLQQPSYQQVIEHYQCSEETQVERLLELATLDHLDSLQIEQHAAALVEKVRDRAAHGSGIDAFMQEYDLSSSEGVVLMCLAEALLRIPDTETIDKLIEDKIGGANWESHLGESKSWFVNASTWGLMLSGRMLRREQGPQSGFSKTLQNLMRRSGEPVIRQAVRQAMRIMGHQFVMGRTIEEALKNAQAYEKRGYTYSYDMLGEAARTQADAQRYFEAYQAAIDACGKASQNRGPIKASGVSVKLSALHPRYELAQRERVLKELLPLVQDLARQAAGYNINLTIDAEEAARLDISLEIFEQTYVDPQLGDWQGLGLAVQAYQKRALDVVNWLADLARQHGRKIMIRLVKGAYWDTEIKLAQENGLKDYPVFTRKANTDVSYLACAKQILQHQDAFYPQFATHNAHTLAYINHLAGDRTDFEYQRLHGMGEDLHQQLVEESEQKRACRIYAPVGQHEDLLAYLVRRLLENGANSSFVNRIVNEKVAIKELVANPVDYVRSLTRLRHPSIPLPANLYGSKRANSQGLDLTDSQALTALAEGMEQAQQKNWQAGALVAGQLTANAQAQLKAQQARAVLSPANNTRKVGEVVWADSADIEQALVTTAQAAQSWSQTPASERAACLLRYADLMKQHMHELVALCALEAGKNIADGVAEVREAVDFCRYYAAQAEAEFAHPVVLPGPTGERNTYSLHGRGVFVVICPWNFPLAILTGQMVAALVAGNAVIVKPAEQTGIIGYRAVQLLLEAGIPADVIAYLPGAGDVGAALVADERIAGVAFTGSVPTAKRINRVLADREGPIIPLIAETGGQNAMIVDSSALPEQVVAAVIRSSFQSAGQRCSALRLLCVQEDIAEPLLKMLEGAMAELTIGDPWNLDTDVTPVIDSKAQAMLTDYANYADQHFKGRYSCKLNDSIHAQGTYFAPRLYELDSISQLGDEKFGPILHVVRFKSHETPQLVEQINQLGYGLTFGIQSRIDSTVEQVLSQLKVGNSYVNRNMIGAVVGVQPFGGQGLSGTGPKAGGPHYLHRFAAERVVSWDTTAAGGNASLMSLEESEPSEHQFVTSEPQRLNNLK